MKAARFFQCAHSKGSTVRRQPDPREPARRLADPRQPGGRVPGKDQSGGCRPGRTNLRNANLVDAHLAGANVAGAYLENGSKLGVYLPDTVGKRLRYLEDAQCYRDRTPPSSGPPRHPNPQAVPYKLRCGSNLLAVLHRLAWRCLGRRAPARRLLSQVDRGRGGTHARRRPACNWPIAT